MKTIRKQIMKVLGIGNSFTNDANFYHKHLNEADPVKQLKVTIAYIGGCSFERHVNLAMLHEKFPAEPLGRPYPLGKSMKSLKELLLSEKWDAITIQQASHLSDDIKSYRPWAALLIDYVKKYSPDSEILVHETWADRIDNPRLADKSKTQTQMYRDLKKAYSQIAAELGNLRIIPVGDAFQAVRKFPDWKFKPDKNFKAQKFLYPELPDQSHTLCIGWFWTSDCNGKPVLAYDHHATSAGKFLAALVWREILLGVDSRENSFTPQNMTRPEALTLRKTAHKICAAIR